MIDWNEFTHLVKQAHAAQADEKLEANQRQHAATFACLGLAILTLASRVDAATNQPLVISTTGDKLV